MSEYAKVDTMGDHGSPWEVEMRDGHEQTEVSEVETIGGRVR